MIGAFLIDFETINFDINSKIAMDILSQFQKDCNLDSSDHNFILDSPMYHAGWYFTKLFLSAQFVKRLYELNLNQINNSKGKNFEDKFISWLGLKFKIGKCDANLKIATEMKLGY